jgi:hypothetical protein
VAPAFDLTKPLGDPQLVAYKVFTPSDYSTALSMARAETPHRT